MHNMLVRQHNKAYSIDQQAIVDLVNAIATMPKQKWEEFFNELPSEMMSEIDKEIQSEKVQEFDAETSRYIPSIPSIPEKDFLDERIEYFSAKYGREREFSYEERIHLIYQIKKHFFENTTVQAILKEVSSKAEGVSEEFAKAINEYNTDQMKAIEPQGAMIEYIVKEDTKIKETLRRRRQQTGSDSEDDD